MNIIISFGSWNRNTSPIKGRVIKVLIRRRLRDHLYSNEGDRIRFKGEFKRLRMNEESLREGVFKMIIVSPLHCVFHAYTCHILNLFVAFVTKESKRGRSWGRGRSRWRRWRHCWGRRVKRGFKGGLKEGSWPWECKSLGVTMGGSLLSSIQAVWSSIGDKIQSRHGDGDGPRRGSMLKREE